MKRIRADELAKLSIDEKLDMILEALGCVDKSIFADGCIDGSKLAASGLKHDKVACGVVAVEANKA